MAKQKKTTSRLANSVETNVSPLVWLKARYELHTFSCRDPRSAFSSATAIPVPSPTAILLGICSTLYYLDRNVDAKEFLHAVQHCRVKVDAPDGVIFFRAFHQLRRYVGETTKQKGKPPKASVGLTDINQGTREYGILQGPIDIYVGVPQKHCEAVAIALANRDRIGTHDSLCSLLGDVEKDVSEPVDVVYEPLSNTQVPISKTGVATIVTLSLFNSSEFGRAALPHWKMSGGDNTELIPFVIPGRFRGTRNGKIYSKR